MTLSKENAELFYELWFPLIDFVNKKFNVIPSMGRIHGARHTNPVQVKEIANVLWDNVQVIDEYLEKHRSELPKEHLEIIDGWKRRISDDFILERNLKSGSIHKTLEPPPNFV